LPTDTSSSNNGGGDVCRLAAAAEGGSAAASETAEITYGRLRVTTATRGCSCFYNNSDKYRPILIILSLLHSQMNCMTPQGFGRLSHNVLKRALTSFEFRILIYFPIKAKGENI